VKFYVGCHQPSDAQHFDRAFISINRLRDRKSPFAAKHWVMDSGAFTEISTHGRYRSTVEEYARDAARWIGNGHLDAVVAQDYMCESFILDKTGLTVGEHQRLTIERYDELLTFNLATYVLPVLQGFAPREYLDHVDAYGDRLADGAWVGVGSVCKRNVRPESVASVLSVIKHARPDLRLHGFGVKLTALRHPAVREHLHSADSMAWSYAARMQGRNGNDWREADQFRLAVERPRVGYFQPPLEVWA
jgi:hypothetical protein